MELRIIIEFLNELAKNNNRSWFSENRDKYEIARKEAENFTNQIINQISLFDSSIQGIKAKDCLYRINKDARFLESNEGPFKENMGAYISKGGKKSPFAAYYIHIEPGYCSLEGGIYWAESPVLLALRDEIYFNDEEFYSIISNQEFITLFNKIE